MPGDSCLACPQGNANLNLLLPRRRAGQEQIGDIGARNQQNEANRAQENEQQGTCVTNDLLLQGYEAHTTARFRSGLRLGKPPGDGVHFGLRLFESHVGFESGHCAVNRIAPAGIEHQRGPHITIRRKMEPSRKNTHDRRVLAVE